MTTSHSTPRAVLALSAVVALGALAFGCGDADKITAVGSAAPAASTTPGTSAAPMADKAAPVPTTSAQAAKPEPAPAASGNGSGAAGVPYERAALLAYLPTECPDGRAYIDVQKMLGGDGGAVKELIEALIAGTTKDKGQAEAVLAELRAGGLDPATSVREIAACVLSGRKPLVAFGIDASKAKDATQTLFAAISKGEGADKVKLVDEGGLKVIKNPRGELLAMVAPNVLVLAKTVDRLKESAKSPGGTAGFAEAPAHVLWLRLTGKDHVDVSVANKGKDYELIGLFPPTGPMIAKIKTDPKGTAEAYELQAQMQAAQLAGSPFASLAAAVKAAQWSIEGERMKVTAKAPKSVVVQSMKSALENPEMLDGFR